MNNGSVEFFIVNRRKSWLKEIENIVTEIKKARGESWFNDQRASPAIVQESRKSLTRVIIGAILTGICAGLLMLFFAFLN